jgi:hypothetical protein
MFSAMNDVLKENKTLRLENERFRKEETSEDHALAALLASGAVTQTPFTIADYFSGKDEDAESVGIVYKGKDKVGVVLRIKNLDAKQRWSMKSARLTTLRSGHERAFAMRVTSSSIAPGESGVLAFVTDKSAFTDDGAPTSLFLEVYRHDGLRQALVQLDPRLVGE